MLRPDLDGYRFLETDTGSVWVVFHGKRHRVISAFVFDDLFADLEGLVESGSLDYIDAGEDLEEGTCLARSGPHTAIYFIAAMKSSTKRHLIRTYESFRDFHFSENAVLRIPDAVLKIVPAGRDLTGSNARSGH